MAELDFSKNVQQIPEAQPLARPYEKTEKVQTSSIPDYQGAASRYASDTNWMSSIGSTVAASASNAIATKLGSKLGKNPQGDIGIPLTDFDKTMMQSYNTQAEATLGIQAYKLISDSNLELSKLPRLNADVIDKTQHQVSIGLQNIFKNAPDSVKPHLEYQYGHQQLGQIADLNERMVREQKVDQRNNTVYSSELNSENAYSFAIKGNSKAADAAVNATKRSTQAAVAARIMTPEQAKVALDTSRQSAKTGSLIHDYEQSPNKEEFLANVSKGDISNPDYVNSVKGLMSHVSMQHDLKREDENLVMARAKNSILEHPDVSGAQFSEWNSHLEPIQQEELKYFYDRKMGLANKENIKIQQALDHYTDINSFPLNSSGVKNGAWTSTWQAMLQKPENVASGMNADQAKLYAAAAAPSEIPAYSAELKLKASTPDPANLEAAGQAMNYFQTHQMGYKLPFDEKQIAMLSNYEQLRTVKPPQEAAQMAYDAVYSKTKEQNEANDEALKNYYQSQKIKNDSKFGWVRKLIQTPEDLKIRNLPGYTQKANETFERFFKVYNGDEAQAARDTKTEMEQVFGETRINGEGEYAAYPLEKIPGMPYGANGAIQSDITSQMNIKFNKDKEFYDKGQSNEWYEARQEISAPEAMTSKRIVDEIHGNYGKNPISGAIFDVNNKRDELFKHNAILDKYNNQTIKIIKHNRSGKDEVYDSVVQGSPWANFTGNPNHPVAGGYDVMIKTEKGIRNITLKDPYNSVVNYNPRVDVIRSIHRDTYAPSIPALIAQGAPSSSIAHQFAPPTKAPEKKPVNPFTIKEK